MTEEILRGFLVEVVKEHNFVDYELEIKPVSSGGSNHTSILYNITLTKGENIVHMFAKVAIAGDQMRSQGPRFYETEEIAYTNVSKVYERLQEEHNVPHEFRLIFPKCYGCTIKKYEETIILEDLVMNGYEAYDRFKPYDWDYAKAAITELAKMHALSYAYGKYYPEEYNKLIETFKWDAANKQMEFFYEKMITKAFGIIREENVPKLQRFFGSFDKEKFAEFNKVPEKPVLCHGDFRPSNLMHRIREDGSVDIKIVDLQTLRGRSPAADLMYFIFTGSDEEFRAQYYDKLLDHYYAELSAAMTRLNLNPEETYSKAEYNNDLKKNLPSGLLLAIFTLPMITADEQDAPKVDQDFDLNAFTTERVSDLCCERMNGVVNDYVKFGILK